MLFLDSSKGEDVISISLFLGFFHSNPRTLDPLAPFKIINSYGENSKLKNGKKALFIPPLKNSAAGSS